MATFHIHEDKENYQQLALQHAKQFFKGEHEKFGAKKHILETNRVTLQPLNNGIRHDAKRIKLSATNNDRVDEIQIVQIGETLDELEVNRVTVFENSFCKIGKENEENHHVKESEKDGFPVCLLINEEYKQDIWQYLKEAETTGPRPKPNYMLKQADLSWNTRSILVDWLVSVADEYKFCDQTFHLSVNYVDRFLSQISVVRGKFQLVGAAAMMVAGKMEEYQALDAQEWSYLTGDSFSVRQILKMEQLIVKALKFKLQPPTICDFVQHLCAEHKMDSEIVHLAMYISDLVLLEGEDYLNQFPSKLAAASIVLARYTLSKRQPWPEKLKKASGYTLKELSPVIQRQQKTFKDSPLKEQQAIQTKYKSDKYNRVALLKPRVLILDDLDNED